MAEQVITTAGQPATPEQPAVFIAGNRKLDKIQLENSLSRYFDTFVSAYQGSWGEKNTQEVRQAYSNMMNAIHDGKVSMNIDGSLQVSDGSIVNSPNKKGFDANAAVAYFVKRVSDTIPDQEVQKPKSKKYTGNTFRGNFIKSLTPEDPANLTNEWWNNNWINLDQEVTDESGNRSRPYTNRLKVFQNFLDKEIANLDNYNEAGEEYGDIDTVKQRMLDLKERLADGDISAEDNLALTRLGFEPSFFTTLGTPKTEEEVAAEKEAAEKAKAEEAAATAKAEEERRSNLGVLNVINGLTNKDSATNPQEYANYLATTYGVGEEGFSRINQTIEGLLNKAYQGSLQGVVGLNQQERRQLGNFIHFIRTNNPAYQNTQLTQEELAELQTHKNFTGGNVFKLPWKTQDGRSIYADNAGKVYFLKPANHKELASQLKGTDSQYKKGFLSGTEQGQAVAAQLKLNAEQQRHIFEDMQPEDLLEITAAADDTIALIASFVPVYGTAIAAAASLKSLGLSTLADVSKSIRGKQSWGDTGTQLLTNAGLAALGLLPGGKTASVAAKLGKWSKVFLRALPFYQAYGIITDPEPYKQTITKMVTNPADLNVSDLDNIKYLASTLAGSAMSGKQISKSAKYSGAREVSVKVKKGTGEAAQESTVKMTSKQAQEIHKAGVEKGKAAADQKLQEVVKKQSGEQAAKDLVLNEGNYAEKPGVLSRGWNTSKNRITSFTDFFSGAREPKLGTLTGKSTIKGNETPGQVIRTDYDIYARGMSPIGRPWGTRTSPTQEGAVQETPRTGGESSEATTETPRTGAETPIATETPANPVKKPYTSPLTKNYPLEASWENTFKPKNFTMSMTRHYNFAKQGLTPEELAIADAIKAKWSTATNAEKQRFASLMMAGTNKVKAQQLEAQRQKAESGGVKSDQLKKTLTEAKKLKGGEHIYTEGKSPDEVNTKHQIMRVPLSPSDKVYSNSIPYRGGPGKPIYLVSHNGRFMLWKVDEGYIDTAEKASKLEAEIPPAIKALIGKEVSSNKFGGKFQQFLELKRRGGIIKAQQGIQINPGTSWYGDIFSTYKQHILNQLKTYGQSYAAWLNSMQDSHSAMYKKAGDNFLNVAYNGDPDSVRSYQQDYLRDTVDESDGRHPLGYNVGIANAAKKGRYKRLGTAGTGTDWSTTNYQPDGLYSGETDDRRILGRQGDFSDEQLAGLQAELKNHGFHLYLDPSNNYYKLGRFGDNGELISLAGESLNNLAGPQDSENTPQNPTDQAPTEEGNPQPPSLATPGISGSQVTGDKQAQGVDLDKYRLQENLPQLLNTSMSIASMLGNIGTTNSNFRTAVQALRQIRLLDPAQKYHQVMDDYAGNQLAANQAAAVRNRTNKAISSDRAFNEARALEGENKALELMRQQTIQDQKIRQQHALTAEQYGNENRAARIDVGNKNGHLMYDLAQKLGNAEQSKRLANWTSIDNFIKENIFKGQQKLDKREAILENWKAQRLGGRNAWINRKLQSDPEYLRALSEYEKISKNTDATEEEKLAAVKKVRQRIAEVQLEAGRGWDQEYAKLYGLPYYEYDDPFEQALSIYQRYNSPVATSQQTPTGTPVLRKGGALDAQVEALKSINSRANSQDITERERLRARKADADRFMKSIWKAMDMYIQQTKNLNKK